MKILDNGLAVLERDSHLSRWIEQSGYLAVDANAIKVAKRFLRLGFDVIDAGASLGDTTQAFLDAVGPTGRVIAVEANREAFLCLQKNCPEALCVNDALGKEEGFGELNDEMDNRGCAWVKPTKRPTAIKITTIDSMHRERLDLLKLDVEGMELAVLQGAEETLARCKPVVMAELNHETLKRNGITPQIVVDYMKERGFRMELVDPAFGLDCPQTDVLFIHESVQLSGMKTIDEIFIAHGCHKGSHWHNYAPTYDAIMTPLRHEPVKLLEMGIQFGFSMRSWMDYFTHPDAKLLGIDINHEFKTVAARYTFYQCDQSKCDLLASDWGPEFFDFIIDDAGHHASPQAAALHLLWTTLKPGGFYFIEDTFTLFHDFWKSALTTGDWLHELFSMLNKGGKQFYGRPGGNLPDGALNDFEKTVQSIEARPGLIILKKRA